MKSSAQHPSQALKSSESGSIVFLLHVVLLLVGNVRIFIFELEQCFFEVGLRSGVLAWIWRSAVKRKIPLPSQRGAKPDQERNEINGRGPPPAGRMPLPGSAPDSSRGAPTDPDAPDSGIKCGAPHLMPYVAFPLMWR
jgi:hypothetical protein